MHKPDLVEIMQREGIQLRPRGKYFWTQCPLHLERTPSFKIDHEKNFFYCFGCGASGDVITFIQKYKGLSFKESLTYLGISGDKPVGPDARELKKRELLKKFNLWVYTKHDSLCALYRELQAIKTLIRTEQDLEGLAYFYHKESLWICQIEILQGNDDQAKINLYKELCYG
jgi:hypothetical protein